MVHKIICTYKTPYLYTQMGLFVHTNAKLRCTTFCQKTGTAPLFSVRGPQKPPNLYTQTLYLYTQIRYLYTQITQYVHTNSQYVHTNEQFVHTDSRHFWVIFRFVHTNCTHKWKLTFRFRGSQNIVFWLILLALS